MLCWFSNAHHLCRVIQVITKLQIIIFQKDILQVFFSFFVLFDLEMSWKSNLFENHPTIWRWKSTFPALYMLRGPNSNSLFQFLQVFLCLKSFKLPTWVFLWALEVSMKRPKYPIQPCIQTGGSGNQNESQHTDKITWNGTIACVWNKIGYLSNEALVM